MPLTKTYATWNAGAMNPNLVLSSGNLRVDTNGGNTDVGGLGNMGKSEGKWYWEYNVFQGGSDASSLGVGRENMGISNWMYVGGDANGYGYLNLNGNKYHNSGSGASYGATYGNNDVIGVALDMDNKTVTFYKNNISQGTAFTGLTGIIFPAISLKEYTNSYVIANFGATALTYAPPAGFNEGLYTITATVKALVLGGGGAGGTPYSGDGAGGGGAGGYQYNAAFSIEPKLHTVTVGEGGTSGNSGGNSVLSTITAFGGGKGVFITTGVSGGCGGGTNNNNGGGAGTQGYGGGSNNTTSMGGGGGGTGGAAYGTFNVNGGDGTINSISGTAVTYGGGGGGGSNTFNGNGSGGLGGGGVGGYRAIGGNGAPNLGGGGGGGGNGNPGGNGGSGIVIISYATDGSDGLSSLSMGGIKTTSGGQTIHTFITSGTFIAVATGSLPPAIIKTLVVAGGGGGCGHGLNVAGGGAGAGGLLYDGSFIITPQSYAITVGTGGAGGNSSSGTVGTNSSFSTKVAIGGAAGIYWGASPTGGSGAGASGNSGTGNGGVPGLGTAGQGNNGGIGVGQIGSTSSSSGGGGGAGGVGGNAPDAFSPGAAGPGLAYSISGSSITYASGGAGNSPTGGSGAAGSTPGSGGGGCGGAGGTGGNGSNGIVIISYATDGSDGISPLSTGGTKTTSGGQTIHTFTTSGTFTVVEPTKSTASFLFLMLR